MVQLVKPVQTKVVSKDGECHITLTLEINLNLNTQGISVSASASPAEKLMEDKQKEKVDWAIPDFTMQKEKIKFGKKE